MKRLISLFILIPIVSWGCAPISSKSPKFTRIPVISRATGDMLYDSINPRYYYIEKLKVPSSSVRDYK